MVCSTFVRPIHHWRTSMSRSNRYTISAFLTAILLCIAFTLTGCGTLGGGSGTPTSDTAKAIAICHVVAASINTVTLAGSQGWIPLSDLNAAQPYIKTVADTCDGSTPPTLATVLGQAFTDAETYLAGAATKANTAAAAALKAVKRP
jgi:hypothetical protein